MNSTRLDLTHSPRPLNLFVMLAIAGAATMLASCQSTAPKQGGAAWRIDPLVRVSGTPERMERSGDSYYQLGRYYDGQRRTDRALEAYRRAVRAEPSHQEAHNALGVLLARQGRIDDAITELEAAASLADGKAHVLSNLGYAYLLAGRNDDAVRILGQAARLDPSNAKARSNLAMAIQRGGMPGQAVVAMEERSVTEPSSSPVLVASDATSTAAPVTVVTNTATETVTNDRVVSSVQVVTEVARAGAVTIVEGSSMEAVEVAPNVVEIRAPEGTAIASKGADIPVSAATPSRPESMRTYRLEIANGMGVTGTARRVGAMLREEGAPAARLTDQRPFRQVATVVQFAAGYQREAGQVAEWLGTRPVQVDMPGLKPASVRVVIGRDILPVLAARSTPSEPKQALRLIASN